MRTIVVSASDDNYLPVAKGLWLSLRGIPDVDLGFVDFGHSDETLAWFSENAPDTVIRRLPDHIDEMAERLQRQYYHRALLLRPYLPDIYPDYECIIWIDSDAWVQEHSTIGLFRDAVRSRPDSVALTPVLDVTYYPLFDFPGKFIDENVTPVYEAFYGASIAQEFRYRPILACGTFAMHRDCALWHRWRKEVERLYERRSEVPTNIFHVADQTAFNYLAYTSGLYTLLDARHSYLANVGRLHRGASGKVETVGPEARTIGIIQISDIVNRGLATKYLEEGLLFERGDYLSKQDHKRLSSIVRP